MLTSWTLKEPVINDWMEELLSFLGKMVTPLRKLAATKHASVRIGCTQGPRAQLLANAWYPVFEVISLVLHSTVFETKRNKKNILI